ncbi:uncharacterized protein N7469_009312 [Penicillium citrinum]|uniref:Protein kinase domain-containing protein n=2 Tax=Penicillium TaxID=5073 RepID=A0A9W9NN61_PENCI|nr:uncharacterized protein N7469_009312 [Penicillium citrinum]KAJ5223072.1 hypothetical protein N7469_009312 [Penicillium citrinum]
MPLDHIPKPANGGHDPLANYNDGRKAVQGPGSLQSKKFAAYPGLERWELLDVLGTGAFSKVYRASDREGKEGTVAVKVLRKFDMNEQQRSNIQKEIQIMRQLRHPNVTEIIDTVETGQYCHIIMKLSTGGELFNQLVKLTFLSEDLAKHVIKQVAEAVRYLHQDLGVVHRDIKPENIFFDSIPMKPSTKPRRNLPGEEDKVDEGDFIPGTGGGGIGVVKLGDFGLSKVISGMTTATPCGTMSYAAPEIVRDEKYTTGVDMWAIGCVLYTLLAGYPPFYDPDTKVLMKKVARGDYTFDSPWWDDVSNDAKDVVSKTLTVNTDERLSIEQFLDHPWFKELGDENDEPESPTTPKAEKTPDINVEDTNGASTPQASEASEAIRESRVEARTPGFMNVRELFDVVFSAHRHEQQNNPQKQSPEQQIESSHHRRTSSGHGSILDKLDIGNSALFQKRNKN